MGMAEQIIIAEVKRERVGSLLLTFIRPRSRCMSFFYRVQVPATPLTPRKAPGMMLIYFYALTRADAIYDCY